MYWTCILLPQSARREQLILNAGLCWMESSGCGSLSVCLSESLRQSICWFLMLRARPAWQPFVLDFGGARVAYVVDKVFCHTERSVLWSVSFPEHKCVLVSYGLTNATIHQFEWDVAWCCIHNKRSLALNDQILLCCLMNYKLPLPRFWNSRHTSNMFYVDMKSTVL